MRIQNNVTAMNTHRMYTMNNDAVAASAKKLSSGYRINSAADDAAGLAISEKMRSQIRGLNMATKNSQDAISLVQTAEGALQETQNMLQRMNELAVQAATGTNEDLDRTALAKEFEQLKREINDVAEQTNFNNMKILDGSLSYKGYVRSAATAGVNLSVEQNSKVADSGISATLTAASASATGLQGQITLDSSAWGAGSSDKEKAYDLVFKVDGQLISADKITGKITATNEDAADEKTMFGGSVSFEAPDGTTFTFDGANGVLKTDNPSNFDMSRVEIGIVERDPNRTNYGEGNLTTMAKDTDKDKTFDGLKASGATTQPKLELDFDMSKMQDGDSIKIGDKTYVFYADKRTDAELNAGDNAYGRDADGNKVSATTAGDTINIIYNATGSTHASAKGTAAAEFVTAFGNTTAQPTVDATAATPGHATAPAATTFAAALANPGSSTVNVTGTVGFQGATAASATQSKADQFKVDQDLAEKANAALKYDINSVGSKNSTMSTVEFDVAKMKDGDKFTITAGQAKIEVTFNGESRKDFMKKVDDAVKTAGADGFAEVKGNALIVTDKSTKVELDSSWKDQSYADQTNALRIQVGALENEQLSVAIDSMNTASLGLDNSFLAIAGNSNDQNIDEAGKAITATREAINRVSDQRATLGAMQNRLDHKIANLKTTAENLTASESRIRDVDMAQEMTNFTKNNILSQAATAMLAQANSLPQNVLSLLG